MDSYNYSRELSQNTINIVKYKQYKQCNNEIENGVKEGSRNTYIFLPPSHCTWESAPIPLDNPQD